MSQTASVTVSYYLPPDTDKSVLDIIRLYLSNGWNLNDAGHISFRPLGDKDDHDWIELGLGQTKELFEILEKKIVAQEDLGLVFRWGDGGSGAVTTFYPQDQKVDFLLIIYRKIHPEIERWTDISWYLPKILNPLLMNNVSVVSIEYFESRSQ